MAATRWAARWRKVHATATWTLIVVFALMAIAHLVLTVLFYTGVRDTGVGYLLDHEWPAWLITIVDGLAAWLLWSGYRAAPRTPWLGLTLTSVASVMMLARAMWMVFVPAAVVLTMAGAVAHVARRGRRTADAS